jgi:hypothetical protein
LASEATVGVPLPGATSWSGCHSPSSCAVVPGPCVAFVIVSESSSAVLGLAFTSVMRSTSVDAPPGRRVVVDADTRA